MKTNEIVDKVIGLISLSNGDDIQSVRNALYIVLNDYDFSKRSQELAPVYSDLKAKAIQMFFISKKVEGCTDKTINYYKIVLTLFFQIITADLSEIDADAIRFYIANRSMKDKISKTTQDNELRVLKSFFNWCSAEGYICKSPTLNIKPIKQEKKDKATIFRSGFRKNQKCGY